ncbi:KdsC family phosphatase [Polluticaenibacter yanchengensis]|uniref:HAD hydrolase family protein n=1 Tax=Polluticaenibacter yanchengensis TaxID=3014562 RepID=A0ABT4UMX3_9BACT|nr:HAD hydrolase family protein [Chitinophagaceae bacterium LY-5]
MLNNFQLHNINTFVLDVDGVLTDGSLYLINDSEMVRVMNAKDGYALQLAIKRGFRVIVISGGISTLSELRLKKLGISDVYMGVHDKLGLLKSLSESLKIKASEMIYLGDDMPDIEVMTYTGISACPADACTDVLAISKYVSPFLGGKGFVRDVIEQVMKTQNKWLHTNEVVSK